MTAERGERLIFLISPPRAGSTLLQRMLGAHPAIHTTQEAWIMLPLVYARRAEGITAEYSAEGARLFIDDFLATLPQGVAAYDEAVRRAAGYLYGEALAGSVATYFLDKTPPYYFIVPDLQRIFPAARFVLLLRDPLAVLSSILSSWVRGRWFQLYDWRHALMDAPDRLIDARELLGDKANVVHYERLVADPESTLLALCRGLGLDFLPAMVDYGRETTLPRWRLGDQKSVYDQERPSSAVADRWRAELAQPQRWRLAADYLAWLGPARYEALGYAFDEANELLRARRPRGAQRLTTVSLDWLLKRPPEERGLAERGRLWAGRWLGSW